MKIGTPLSTTATRVMLLGSGELGKEVIISLQRLGVEVIAVDRYANAPGHQVAHRAHVINMADPAELRELIEQERPHIIVPEIEAIATDELVKVESEGLAEVIPTARATQLTMNREGIRRLAAEELGLPTSKYIFADTFEQLVDGEKKAALHFRGTKKKLILNLTNKNILVDAYGPETDGWYGKEIILCVMKVPFQGRLIKAVRINFNAQPPTEPIENTLSDGQW